MNQVAVVGVGYWGRNLVRTFGGLPGAVLTWVCDTDVDALDRVKTAHPSVRICTSYDRLLDQKDVQAVVLATPAPTHHALARKALEAGKDVFVEKPLCLSVDDAADLVLLARERKRVLMVGHLMVHHPAVRWIEQRLGAGDLGDPYYLYFQRLNLGIVRQDENAWWSLAPHDVSIALLLLGREPRTVSARGACYLRAGVEELVLGWARDHGAPLPTERIRELLAVDVELNAQGLEAWLDRDRR